MFDGRRGNRAHKLDAWSSGVAGRPRAARSAQEWTVTNEPPMRATAAPHNRLDVLIEIAGGGTWVGLRSRAKRPDGGGLFALFRADLHRPSDFSRPYKAE